MKISKEVKVGLLAAVSLAMLYFGFNYLKGSDFFSHTNHYHVIYDNVDGLTPSNAVTVNGLTVGQVKAINILQNQGNKLDVTLDVGDNIRITKGSQALLADGGLLGGKTIKLAINQRTGLLEDGGMLVPMKEQGITALIREKTLPVLNNVDSLTYQLNRIVGQFDQTGIILNQTLRGANKVTGTLDATLGENRQTLRTLLGNVTKLSASLTETEHELKPILLKAGSFADSLNALQLRQTLNNANQSIDNLQKILADINKGRGSIGKLATDEQLYRNVNATTASLEKLLTDLRENPKRYVHFSLFGRKEKPTVAKPGSVSITTVTTTTVDSLK